MATSTIFRRDDYLLNGFYFVDYFNTFSICYFTFFHIHLLIKYIYLLLIMITPIVKPVNVKEYEFKQSKYDVAPRLPFSQIITGPSGSGKGILLQSMILDIYRNVFERIYVWSPLISVDSNWTPVKRYIQDELKVDLEMEKCFFDEYIPEELERVIKQQHKVIEYQKKNDHKKLFSILVIVDDFADSKASSRNSPLLNQLYVRGRHNAINIITATQKFNALSPIIRVNSRQLFFLQVKKLQRNRNNGGGIKRRID